MPSAKSFATECQLISVFLLNAILLDFILPSAVLLTVMAPRKSGGKAVKEKDPGLAECNTNWFDVETFLESRGLQNFLIKEIS